MSKRATLTKKRFAELIINSVFEAMRKTARKAPGCDSPEFLVNHLRALDLAQPAIIEMVPEVLAVLEFEGVEVEGLQ